MEILWMQNMCQAQALGIFYNFFLLSSFLSLTLIFCSILFSNDSETLRIDNCVVARKTKSERKRKRWKVKIKPLIMYSAWNYYNVRAMNWKFFIFLQFIQKIMTLLFHLQRFRFGSIHQILFSKLIKEKSSAIHVQK